jgi:hypothetical protein
MKTTSLLGTVCACLLLFVSTPSSAVLIDDFEHGTLANWTVGGRQNFTWTADVVSRHGSLMGHVYKNGFTEVTLENTFNYTPDLAFTFDMEVRSFNNVGGGAAFYGMGSAEFVFFDSLDNQLGIVRYANASNNYLSSVSSTRDDLAYNAVAPNVLQHYSLAMSSIISQLVLQTEDISKVTMRFRAYASGYNSGMGGEVWFDNATVSNVPIPAAVWLFASGLMGLVGMAGRTREDRIPGQAC